MLKVADADRSARLLADAGPPAGRITTTRDHPGEGDGVGEDAPPLAETSPAQRRRERPGIHVHRARRVTRGRLLLDALSFELQQSL